MLVHAILPLTSVSLTYGIVAAAIHGVLTWLNGNPENIRHGDVITLAGGTPQTHTLEDCDQTCPRFQRYTKICRWICLELRRDDTVRHQVVTAIELQKTSAIPAGRRQANFLARQHTFPVWPETQETSRQKDMRDLGVHHT